MWECPATAVHDSFKSDCQVEEAFGLKLVDYPAPASDRDSATHEGLVELLLCETNRRRECGGDLKILAATDGGSTLPEGCDRAWEHLRRGGVGIALDAEGCDADVAFGGKLQGMDQGPYAAEAAALLVLLRALAAAAVDAHIIIDNSAVGDGLQRVLDGGFRPPFGFAVWEEVATLCQGRSHSTEWVPAHNRHKEWEPKASEFGSADHFRRLNDLAYQAASGAAGSEVGKLTSAVNAHTAAADTATVCLKALAEASKKYEVKISERLAAIGETTWREALASR